MIDVSLPISSPCPISRPEIPNIWHRLVWYTLGIGSIQVHVIPPPVRESGTGVRDAKENNNATDGKTCIKCSCQDIIVLGPPSKELALNEVIEGKVDQRPAGIVDSGGCEASS